MLSHPVEYQRYIVDKQMESKFCGKILIFDFFGRHRWQILFQIDEILGMEKIKIEDEKEEEVVAQNSNSDNRRKEQPQMKAPNKDMSSQESYSGL